MSGTTLGISLVCGMLLLAYFANGEPARAESEESSMRSPWDFKSEGSPSQRKGVRPPDDSDPEMRRVWLEILGAPNCKDFSMTCEPRASLFKSGGDRLAEYLIRQYEESVIQGHPGAGHYMLYIATTGSERGIRYVLDEYQNPKRTGGRSAALQGLLDARDPRASDVALRLLNDEKVTGRMSKLALEVLTRNAEGPHRAQGAAC